jgi:hypothetical protein
MHRDFLLFRKRVHSFLRISQVQIKLIISFKISTLSCVLTDTNLAMVEHGTHSCVLTDTKLLEVWHMQPNIAGTRSILSSEGDIIQTKKKSSQKVYFLILFCLELL